MWEIISVTIDAFNDTLPEEKGSKIANNKSTTKPDTIVANDVDDDASEEDTGEDLWSEVLNEKSDEEKCRKNWTKGVQSTEDFFAGKGNPKFDTKSNTTTIHETANKDKNFNKPTPEVIQADKPKEKPKEAPKKENVEAKEENAAPRVPQGDCAVCDRSAKAICSGNMLKCF